MTRFHPWRALRALAHLDVEWVGADELPPGALGSTDGTRIRMLKGQGQAVGRCTITHEMVHVERGHTGRCDRKAEARVKREAARRLIPVRALADAIVFHGEDWDAVADELWVDLDTLETRLRHLHPAERGYIRRRLLARDGAA